MKSQKEALSPIHRASILNTSETQQCGLINCRALSSISVTGRTLFNASGTGNVSIILYYSPDGKNFGSTAFSTLTLTCSAGNTVQASAIISVPDTGFIKIVAVNADATYTTTNLAVWVSQTYQFIEDRQTISGT